MKLHAFCAMVRGQEAMQHSNSKMVTLEMMQHSIRFVTSLSGRFDTGGGDVGA